MTYSSAVAASRRNVPRRNQNSVSFLTQEKVLGPISNSIILIILGCLVGLLYLTQITRTNGFGYQINSLQKQQDSLRSQKADLEIGAARLQSRDRVSASAVAKSLVPVSPSGTITQ